MERAPRRIRQLRPDHRIDFKELMCSALAHTPAVSHQVKPVDLLVAAIADEHAVGVLRYDHDYDVIAEHSGLRLRSVWIAPRGSID